LHRCSSLNIRMMVQPPLSVGRHDPVRLGELKRLCVLDSSPERAYDDITRLLATELAVPITMVNLLDEERDWFKSCYGVQQTQSPAVTSFSEMFVTTAKDVIVVNDTLLDERLARHPLVIGRPFIRFYAAARLVVKGQTVGTLCAYDVAPREITPDQVLHLQQMAGAVVEFLMRHSAPS
jgi:GAF domain-containing protein